MRNSQTLVLALAFITCSAEARTKTPQVVPLTLDIQCEFSARHEDGGRTESKFFPVQLAEDQASRLFQDYLPATDGPLFTVDAYGGLVVALTKHLVSTSQWQGDYKPEFQLTLARAFDENSGPQKSLPRFVTSSASSVVQSVRFFEKDGSLLRTQMTQGIGEPKLVAFNRISIDYTVVRPRENPFLFDDHANLDLSNPAQTDDIGISCNVRRSTR